MTPPGRACGQRREQLIASCRPWHRQFRGTHNDGQTGLARIWLASTWTGARSWRHNPQMFRLGELYGSGKVPL